jgi:hypothetical protein
MGLKSGEDIYYRTMSSLERHVATVVSITDEDILLRVHPGLPTGISKGQRIVISCKDLDCHTEVIGIEGNILTFKRIWSGKREYFRADDFLPVLATKAMYDPSCRKSKVFLGYNMEITDMEAPDETINPRLWKMLVEINTKLGLILERLQLESEGFTKGENKQVNISESGMRFIMNERVEAGDVLEIKLLLSSSPPLGILTYGNVVRVNNIGDGKYEVALHFSDMDDEVREEISKHILKRQRGIIKKQLQQIER